MIYANPSLGASPGLLRTSSGGSAFTLTKEGIAAGIGARKPSALEAEGVPTFVWFGLGALVIGGGAYWYFSRH